MAEDHGLCDGDGAVNVAQRGELLLFAVAQDVVLLDVVQGLLFALQLDDVGVGHDPLGEPPHRVLERGGEEQHLAVPGQAGRFRRRSPLDADALVLVSLRGDHNVGLIEHENLDLLGVDELQLVAPVQDGARRADDDVLLNLLPSVREPRTFIAANGVGQLHFGIELSHLLDHLSQLFKRLDGVERGAGVSLQNLHLVGGVDQAASDQLVEQRLHGDVL
uniref:Uncharacterized protein n=1 Tax=Denticeps clupeoides TaxID=299321 RepID=A0A8C4CGB6_9TELE